MQRGDMGGQGHGVSVGVGCELGPGTHCPLGGSPGRQHQPHPHCPSWGSSPGHVPLGPREPGQPSLMADSCRLPGQARPPRGPREDPSQGVRRPGLRTLS